MAEDKVVGKDKPQEASGTSRREVLMAGVKGAVAVTTLAAVNFPVPDVHAGPKKGGKLIFATPIELPGMDPHTQGAESRVRRSVNLYENLRLYPQPPGGRPPP